MKDTLSPLLKLGFMLKGCSHSSTSIAGGVYKKAVALVAFCAELHQLHGQCICETQGDPIPQLFVCSGERLDTMAGWKSRVKWLVLLKPRCFGAWLTANLLGRWETLKWNFKKTSRCLTKIHQIEGNCFNTGMFSWIRASKILQAISQYFRQTIP